MTPPSIAALLMVRNEEHIVATCIGHLLNTLRVDRVYVTDNGSTDGTPDILRRIASRTDRVVLASDAGDFRQGEIITALARRAAADGFTWLLPTDADEFFWFQPGHSLATLCRRDGIGGYRLEMCNFLQARPIRRDWPGALGLMAVAAIPSGTLPTDAARVGAGTLPFVCITYPTKLLLRATPALTIAFGGPDAAGTAGPLVPTTDAEILHAPLRAFDRLHRRAEAGRRSYVTTPEPNQSWHIKRIAEMNAAELEPEWRRNSFSLLHPITRGETRLDLRLTKIARQQTAFRRSLA
ncbi:MAG: glycosyltransferase family 2 protein [Janthinobacterium lividum]